MRGKKQKERETGKCERRVRKRKGMARREETEDDG